MGVNNVLRSRGLWGAAGIIALTSTVLVTVSLTMSSAGPDLESLPGQPITWAATEDFSPTASNVRIRAAGESCHVPADSLSATVVDVSRGHLDVTIRSSTPKPWPAPSPKTCTNLLVYLDGHTLGDKKLRNADNGEEIFVAGTGPITND